MFHTGTKVPGSLHGRHCTQPPNPAKCQPFHCTIYDHTVAYARDLLASYAVNPTAAMVSADPPFPALSRPESHTDFSFPTQPSLFVSCGVPKYKLGPHTQGC